MEEAPSSPKDTPETGTAAYAQLQVHIAQRQAALKAVCADMFAAKAQGPFAGAPLTVEFGCGHGHYLNAYAAAHPQEFCIGLDIKRERVALSNKKCARAGLKNAVFILAEGMEFLGALAALQGECTGGAAADALDAERFKINKTLVLFPDPWPKKRHWRRRLVQPAFLSALAGQSAPGAQLFFRSDHFPYVEFAQEHLAQHANWALHADAAANAQWPFEHTSVFQNLHPTFGNLVADVI